MMEELYKELLLKKSNSNIDKHFISLYKKNDEFIQGLKYAQLLQSSILPKLKHFERHFDETFILFKPLAYVSGDFYWIRAKGDSVYVAVGDCAGHGVRGAMMSMLGFNILNHIFLNNELVGASEILTEMDKKVLESFSNEQETNDWMDISLIKWDKLTNVVEYSGANRKIVVKKENSIETITSNKYPIGGWQIEKDRNYPSKSFKVNKGDIIYIGTDGYQDQIGVNGKKFKSRNLNNLLNSISNLPFSEQKNILESKLEQFMVGSEQIDDITLIGLKI